MKHGLFRELKRRHVYRVAIAYAVVGWLVIQAAATVSPYLHLPDTLTTMVIVVVALGFPVAIILAWAFEMTPEGVRRTEPADSPEARASEQHHRIGRTLDRIIIGVLTVAVALLLANTFLWHKGAGKKGVSAQVPAKSIAVLPLTNDSGDKDQQYFSDGLSENLIIALSQFPGLKVIGRTSSFRFRHTKLSARKIGQELGVAHLLEGSVQHAGDEVRISAELINAADGSTLWSRHYDRPYKNLFELQDTITKAVADALKAKLLPGSHEQVQTDRPPNGSLDAYNAYLQGKFYFARDNAEDDLKAIAKFEQATQLDPGYAQVWVELAKAQIRYAATTLDHASAQPYYTKARAEAEKALSLSPKLADAHVVLGVVRITSELDWNGAMPEYRRAVQLAPEDASAKKSLAQLLATFGQLDRAIALTREALRTEPLNAVMQTRLGTYLMGQGHLDEAEKAYRAAKALQPTSQTVQLWMVYLDMLRGHAATALTDAKGLSKAAGWRDLAVALALQISPDRKAADEALDKIVHGSLGKGWDYQIAQMYAARNDADHTFAWLDRAWTTRDPGLEFLLYDPFIDRFKHDPRFAAFCRKIGLPPPSTVATDASPSGDGSH